MKTTYIQIEHVDELDSDDTLHELLCKAIHERDQDALNVLCQDVTDIQEIQDINQE